MARINRNAKFQILSRSATGSSDYNVTGLFSDETSLYASTDVEVNDRLVDLAGNIYRIAAINSNASIMDLDLEDIEGKGLPNAGGGSLHAPTGCVPINLPASGIAGDLSNFLTHDRIINIVEYMCDDAVCQYTASVTEVTGATFEGVTINDTFIAYSGTTITLNTQGAKNDILTFLNGLGLGVFQIQNYNVAASGTTYDISSSNVNTVNSIRHNDGSDNDTLFDNSCEEVIESGETIVTEKLHIYNSNEALIKATDTGVTFTMAPGVGTIRVPDGVTLEYFRINATSSDLNPLNQFEIHIIHQGSTGNGYTGINDSLDGFYPPTVNILDRSIDNVSPPPAASGVTPYTYNVGTIMKGREIISVAGGSVEIRLLNMDSFLEWTVVVNF